jgi:hypothetical protein
MGYVHLAIVDIATVLEAIERTQEIMSANQGRCRKMPKSEFYGHMVNISSLRLRTFLAKGCTCVSCGLEGSFFAVDKFETSTNAPHLNLWAVTKNGDEVLMTHDHTISRGQGGLDELSNTQPMCTTCNFQKSLGESPARINRKHGNLEVSHEISPDVVRERRG